MEEAQTKRTGSDDLTWRIPRAARARAALVGLLPLAPIPEGIEEESPMTAVPVMMAPPARESAATAAKGLPLSGVCARAQAHLAIRTYLASVYARMA